MKKIILILTAMIAGNAPAETIERSCVVSNEVYIVKYDYNPNGPYCRPLTYPLGQPHYDCQVGVFKGTNQVGRTFDGTVTEKGCFEDVPADMVRRVMAEHKPVQIGIEMTNFVVLTNFSMQFQQITDSIIMGTNWIYDPLQEIRKTISVYYKCSPMKGDGWWQGPAGSVTDTNLVKLLELWKRLLE